MLETITNIASVVLVQVIYFNRTCSNNVVKVVKRVMTCSAVPVVAAQKMKN